MSVGVDGLTIKTDEGFQFRTPYPDFTFRGRTFEECEGVDFWDLTIDEQLYILMNSSFYEDQLQFSTEEEE